jgi:uncharacterized protein YrzB (UPF0473 family)
MEINEKQMIVYDNEGNEVVVEILFTYESEERGCKYVLFFEEENPDEIIAMKYNDEGELEAIEDDEEYSEVEEVLNCYLEDLK